MHKRQDSKALIGAFSSIYNDLTGLGSDADKSQHAEINGQVIQLPVQYLKSLPRTDGIIRRACFLHPMDAFRGMWYSLKFGNDAKNSDTQEVKKYIDMIKGNVRKSFLRASALARQHGDAFILLGIADGRRPDKPVNKDAIVSVRWIKVVTKYQLSPEYYMNDSHNPEYYRLYLFNDKLPDDNGSGKTYNDMLWHSSRVLRFSGDYLFDESLEDNGGYHDSIIQSMFNAWLRWEQGIQASSAMLVDYDVFTLGIKDLGEKFDSDHNTESEIAKNQTEILERGRAINMGKSVIKAILHDLENELPGSVTRSYAGAENIMDRLENAFAAVSSVPKFKLFNEIASAGLTTGAQAAAMLKAEWGVQNQSWVDDTAREPLETLVKYCQLAQDSPTKGTYVESSEIEFPLNVVLSPLEQAELQKLIAERDKFNIESGLYTGMEARIMYERPEFDIGLELKSVKDVKDYTPTKKDLNPEPEPTRLTPTKAVTAKKSAQLRTDDATPVKKYFEWQGFRIGLQYLPFQQRHGKTLMVGYGWFANTRGADGMAADCYVCPNPTDKLFVVEQMINGKFDEEKFIVGAQSVDHARAVYLGAMPADFMGQVREVSFDYLAKLYIN
ncbi:MAG: phage portal protein [Cyanobacteria bacterium J06629_18]